MKIESINIDILNINFVYKFLLNRFINERLESHLCCNGNLRSTYNINRNLHKEKIFQKLVEKINLSSKNFFKDDLLITCMWANVGEYGSNLSRHKHIEEYTSEDFKNYGITGVFYLKKPKNSGNFIADQSIIEVKENQILFFSPHLFHETQINQSDQKRVSVSFNGYLIPKNIHNARLNLT